MPLYPFMFVAPDGRVVDAGPDTDDAAARRAAPASGRHWRATRRSPAAARSCTGPARSSRPAPGPTPTTAGRRSENKSAVLDLDQTVPAWRSVAPMKWARTYHTLTVLPDGDVLALGGQGVAGANSLPEQPGAAAGDLAPGDGHVDAGGLERAAARLPQHVAAAARRPHPARRQRTARRLADGQRGDRRDLLAAVSLQGPAPRRSRTRRATMQYGGTINVADAGRGPHRQGQPRAHRRRHPQHQHGPALGVR